MQVKTLGMTIGEISMTLKEAIDIGRVMHCVTIADVDDLIYHLYEDMGIFQSKSSKNIGMTMKLGQSSITMSSQTQNSLM